MKIRSLKTAKDVLNNFEGIFKFDTPGQKHYVFFEDKETGDIVTIMKYPQGLLTSNRRGDVWFENGESNISEDECARLFFKNRSEINKIIELRLGKRRG